MTIMIAMFSEYERDLIVKRKREGIEIVKNLGKYKGRKPIKLPDNYKELIFKHFNSTIVNPYRAEQCRKDLKLTKSTFYNVLKKEKLLYQEQEQKNQKRVS